LGNKEKWFCVILPLFICPSPCSEGVLCPEGIPVEGGEGDQGADDGYLYNLSSSSAKPVPIYYFLPLSRRDSFGIRERCPKGREGIYDHFSFTHKAFRLLWPDGPSSFPTAGKNQRAASA